MDAQIRIRNVGKVFRANGKEVEALRDITVDIPNGQFACLLGPSGCGKSTLLNAVAGFSLPTSGSVEVDGRPVEGPGPDRGMVFQEYALFPWMTVEQNVAFGLEIRKSPAAEVREKVSSLLAMLNLSEFRDRYPKDLSGGMRQRVAIARVLALDSRILLMDEPFGALDALTRHNLQDELLRIWEAFRKTVLFVTHSIEESIFLADRILVMTYRPGTIKRDIVVTLPRPRDPGDPGFSELKRELTQLVMEEQRRHERDEALSAARE
ncbi:MAG TPA: ABC transporter ATP-binding protein [Candidatus Deferrimicrobium sp.]|nr:ABC transporter ATP-binding protein [Candidatus Deferrimicrobium sp.]